MGARVRVPATTANLGPGFDVLGLSLSLYNILEFEERSSSSSVRIEVSGEGVDDVPRLAEYNLAYRGFARYFEVRNRKPPGVRLHLYNEVPVTRGLGSSATAIVSGIYAAAILDGKMPSQDELLRLAVQIEGHPDNVAPAIYGGFVVSGKYGTVEQSRLHTLRFLAPPELSCIVAVPSFCLSTQLARRVLPPQVSFADAVQNAQNVSLMIAALASGQLERLEQIWPDAIEDRLHQPYRLPLIKGSEQVMAAAKEAGAFSVALSGAGPSLIAFARQKPGQDDRIGNAMRQTFAKCGVSTRILQLKPESAGAHLL